MINHESSNSVLDSVYGSVDDKTIHRKDADISTITCHQDEISSCLSPRSMGHGPVLEYAHRRFGRSSVVLVGCIIFVAVLIAFTPNSSIITTKITTTGTSSEKPFSLALKPATLPSSLLMPPGVNIGAWLALEDYFFSGSFAKEIATPSPPEAGSDAVGSCLPPLYDVVTDDGLLDHGPVQRWRSETDLLDSMTQRIGLGKALRAFHAYRMSFIDWEEDPRILRSIGVKHVRVPMSW